MIAESQIQELVASQDHNQAGATPVMGRRVLRISTGFLPLLMGKGLHHYSVFKDAVPEDCRVLTAKIEGGDLVFLVESEEWGPSDGTLAPEVRPCLVRHHCR